MSLSSLVQSRSLHNLQSSQVMHALQHPYTPQTLPGFPKDKEMDEIKSLIEKFHRGPRLAYYNLGSQNSSLDKHDDHIHGDPITGRIAAVTLHSQRDARFQPNADDM